MKTGQVIGATDRIAGEAVARPVTFGELFATLYHNLGIDANQTTIHGPHRPAAVPGRGQRPSRCANSSSGPNWRFADGVAIYRPASAVAPDT